MQNNATKIGQFLVTNTVWIFLTTIIFISFQRIMLIRVDTFSEGMIYLAPEKWQLFYQFAASIAGLFLPVLFFSYFRKPLQKALNKWLFRGLWLYCFVLHWILALHFQLDQFFPVLPIQADTPLIFGISLFLMELVIQFNDFLLERINLKRRLQKINVEKAIVLFLVSIAFIFSFPPFNRSIVDKVGVYYALEIFLDFLRWLLLFGVGYLFYRINHYLLIEKVFKTKGIFYYGFAFIGLALLFLPIFALIIGNFLVSEQIWKICADEWIPKGTRNSPFYVFPNALPWQWMVLSIPVILVYQWWKQKNDIIQLENEKSIVELNALKQQINPHFLFNTLNTLYALGIEEKSEKTTDGIAKLGTLMRYNLNDAKKTLIDLAKEVDYIKQYIALQQLRLTKNNQLHVQIEKSRLEMYKIAPLLLIPFIENAFKFGVSATEKTNIIITIKVVNQRLVMHIYNTIPKNRPQTAGNGIGISNTRKRLTRLYPNQYELLIEETPTEFEVHLDLNLLS